MRRHLYLILLGCLTLLNSLTPTFGQALPPNVTILVPFPAGGPVDYLARQLADGFRQKLSIIAIVENRPGANGVLAANVLRQAKADGQTLLVTGQGLMTINQHLTKMPFDPLKDLTPISGIAYGDAALVVSSNVQANNLKEFVDLARKSNPPLAMAHGGVGNITHLYAEWFKSVANLNFTYVPYKGVQPALQDTAGGFVTGLFTGLVAALPLIEGKKIKALGVMGERRDPLLPDVPTMIEQGYPISDASWFALVGPPNFSPQQAKLIADLVSEIISQDVVTSTMAKAGLYPWLKKPDELVTLMTRESGSWKELILKNRIEIE